MLNKAKQTAKTAHERQFRKSKFKTKYPYFEHLHSVAMFVKMFDTNKSCTNQIVAYLHDIIEDCSHKGFNFDYIEKEFGIKIALRVDELSNKKVDPLTKKTLSKDEWKSRKKEIQIYHVKNMNEDNQLVKACDQISNMIDFAMIEPEDHTLEKRIEYVEKAYAVILACDKLNKTKLHPFAKNIFELVSEFLQAEKSGCWESGIDAKRLNMRTSLLPWLS